MVRYKFWWVLLMLALGWGMVSSPLVLADTVPGIKLAQGLDARVRAYWQARVAGDLITQYQYEQSKATGKLSLQQYVSGSGSMSFLKARVLDVQLTDSKAAEAKVAIEARFPGLSMLYKSVIEDRWVKIDGEWYHAPLPPKM